MRSAFHDIILGETQHPHGLIADVLRRARREAPLRPDAQDLAANMRAALAGEWTGDGGAQQEFEQLVHRWSPRPSKALWSMRRPAVACPACGGSSLGGREEEGRRSAGTLDSC